jgi:hypothetical protein
VFIGPNTGRPTHQQRQPGYSKLGCMETSIIPLMICFKGPAQRPQAEFTYDEEAQLNVSWQDGQLQPTVLLPNSLASMKSIGQDGED